MAFVSAGLDFFPFPPYFTFPPDFLQFSPLLLLEPVLGSTRSVVMKDVSRSSFHMVIIDLACGGVQSHDGDSCDGSEKAIFGVT